MKTLTQGQLAVLKKARKNLMAKMEGERFMGSMFICNQVKSIVARREGCDNFYASVASNHENPDVVHICNGIDLAIQGQGTVEKYIQYNVTGLSEESILNVYGPLARLAWLDKMIETGEIA